MTMLKGWNYRVVTPDGTMFVDVMENQNGDPIEVNAFIGKAGSSLAAWASATTTMVSLALRSGVALSSIIEELQDITSDGHARIGTNTNCRSGPAGIYTALVLYRNTKLEENGELRGTTIKGLDLRNTAEAW